MADLTPGAGGRLPTWELIDDPQAFLDDVGDVLAADPVRATVVATTARRLADGAARGEPAPDHPCWFAVARDDAGAVAGVAMRTAPHPPHQAYLMAASAPAAAALADLLLERGEVVPAANGDLVPTRAFVDRVAGRTGGAVTVVRPSRLFELGTLAPPDDPPAGEPRPVTPAGVDLAHRWFAGCARESDLQAGRAPRDSVPQHTREQVAARVEAGQLWFWEVHGVPVSMVGHIGPALGVARIAPVFTPAEHRGRGYAGALVAHVSAVLRDAGHRVTLFTDLENPVSNALYERLGYETVVDMAELRIVP